MIKFGSTADNHLRSGQYSFSSRAVDFHRSFSYVIQDAAGRGLDALIVAGDAINTTRPTPYTIKLLKHLHQLALYLKLRVLLTIGNHDRTNPHWTDVLDLSGEYGFELVDNKHFEIRGKDGESLTGYGLPYMSDESLLKELSKLRQNASKLDIIVWHGMVQGFQGARSGNINTSHFTELARITLLGDIHIRQYIDEGGTCIGYPGSTELCRSSEPLEKSYEVFEVTGSEINHYPVPIPTRPVYVERVETLEAADRLVAKLRAHKGDAPLVFVKHAAGITGLRDRIREVLPEESILQIQRMPRNIDMMSSVDFDTSAEPKDFLKNFLPEGSELFSAGERLLIKDVFVEDVIDEYIKNQEAKYATETTEA